MIRINCLVVFLLLLTTQTISAQGMIGFYPFSGNANDASGSGNHGTVFGASLTGSGYQGSAYSFFDGTYINLPININPDNYPQLTMGAWVNLNNNSLLHTVLSHDNGGLDRTLILDDRGPGAGFRYSAFAGSGAIVSTGPDPVNINQWYFVAVRYNQALGTVVLDVDNTRESFTGFTANGVGSLDIGRIPTFGEYFQGSIDNVFVFGRELTDTEIDNIRIGGETVLFAAVPEPSTWALLCLSAAGLPVIWVYRRRSLRQLEETTVG